MVESIINVLILSCLIYALYLDIKVQKLEATREVKRIVIVQFKNPKIPMAYCLNIKAAKEYVQEDVRSCHNIKEKDFEFKWVDLKHPSKK
jgi:hypothetical protein